MEPLSYVLVPAGGLIGELDNGVDFLGSQILSMPLLVLLTKSFVLSSPFLELSLRYAFDILFCFGPLLSNHCALLVIFVRH